jgi:allantoinase
MSEADLVLRGKRVALPAGEQLNPASIHVRGGVVTAVAGYDEIPGGCVLESANDHSILMPGLVDTHVHVNEPGRTDWEGFATATRAAAAGGVTTLIDMPLNSIPPTTTVAGFQTKIEAALNQCYVDVGFWGGVVPGNSQELKFMFDRGVVGFKCFLVHSGVDEFPNVTEDDLREAMPQLARLGAVLIVHAEMPGPIDAACEGPFSESDPRHYKTFLKARPRAAENEAVALMIRLSRECETRVHIVHHSSAEALSLLRKAKDEGVKISAETCPHYLYFAAEEIPDGATQYKCCPPIRERENRERLWDALNDGTIDMVVSDHSPCPSELKCFDSGDFLKAWGGISSLQFRLPVMWTMARMRGHSIANLVEWLCSGPARLVGLDRRKGLIAPGYDADIVIWNPEKEFTVTSDAIHHKHKVTPYEGATFSGVVEKTFLRGKLIYDSGDFARPSGSLLLQTKSL